MERRVVYLSQIVPIQQPEIDVISVLQQNQRQAAQTMTEALC